MSMIYRVRNKEQFEECDEILKKLPEGMIDDVEEILWNGVIVIKLKHIYNGTLLLHTQKGKAPIIDIRENSIELGYMGYNLIIPKHESLKNITISFTKDEK